MISTDPNQALRNTIAVSTAFLPVAGNVLIIGVGVIAARPDTARFHANTTNSWPLAKE